MKAVRESKYIWKKHSGFSAGGGSDGVVRNYDDDFGIDLRQTNFRTEIGRLNCFERAAVCRLCVMFDHSSDFKRLLTV